MRKSRRNIGQPSKEVVEEKNGTMGGDYHVEMVPHLYVVVVEMESIIFTSMWSDW